MTDATSGDVPSVERTWSAPNLLRSFSEAATAVQPENLGKQVEDLPTASTCLSKLDLLQPSELRKQQEGSAFITAEEIEPRSPNESRLPTSPSSQSHSLGAKHSSSTMSVLSAAAASLKDKTHQVTQQQKRALSAFQQKGGLVGWLHGELDGSDPHHSHGSNTIASAPTTPRLPSASDSSTFIEISRRATLSIQSSPGLPIESPITKRFVAEKSVGRRRSMPNIGSGSLLDNFFDKVSGVMTGQPSSPSSFNASLQAHARVKLRPAVATAKSPPSSFDDFLNGQQAGNPRYHAKAPSSPEIGRQRAATTDLPHANTGTNGSTSPALIKAQSSASLSTLRPSPNTRFSLDDVLSDEWSCTVLWAHLYSSAAGRDHQHHQRLSFLIETTFRITPLYRKLAGTDDTSSDKESDSNKLVTSLKRLHCRFLMQNGASAHATSGVPVASPAASHAKNQLSVVVHTLTGQRMPDNESAVDTQVEKAVSSLLQLAREVEREFRVLGTISYTNFADSTLYRDFISHKSGPGNIAVLLRAARIPFYQQPNGVVNPVCLDSLASEPNEDPATVFSRAGCQAFIITTQPDGSIKFTDTSPDTNSSSSSTEPITGQTRLLHTIEPFLNPSANIHPAASKPLAFNFTAGSGDNIYYGAVMWLPVDQNNGLGTEEMPGGLCIISKFPLVDSMRYFLSSLWKDISNNVIEVNGPQVISASLDMGTHFLARQRDDNDQLPAIDFKLDDLVDNLSLTHILRLFAFVLLEKKIVLVASSYTILFSVSETLRVLLHPLVWSHVYVPVLPLALKDCLQCPTPFIFGLHDSYVRRSDMPRPSNDLVVVNLDRDSLTGGGDVHLPPLRHSMMREELFRLCKPHLASRDSVETFDGSNSSLGSFPAPAVRRVFQKHLREILASLEPCVNRFELNDQLVSVVDNVNSSQWPADTARFCSAMLHTQAVSTYLASPRSDERTKSERIFV